MSIFHYCSEQSFKKILSSKKIWLTPVDTMNDREEIIHLYKNVWEKAKSKLLTIYSGENERNTIHIVDDEICKVAFFVDMPYCACFSDNGDLLQQWRLYADEVEDFPIPIAWEDYAKVEWINGDLKIESGSTKRLHIF